MSTFLEERLKKCKNLLKEKGLDGIIISNLKNVYYLTGFSGTAATIFLTAKRSLFITDARYSLLAKAAIQGFDIIESRTPLAELAQILKTDKLEQIGFEADISYAYYENLKEALSTVNLLPQNGFIEGLRLIKDASEIKTIAKACSISDKAFIDVLDFIKAGQTTEIEVANFLDFRMRHYGASGLSFDTIVASGYRSAMPHGQASHKVIENGDSLTMDFGCYYNHYVSDMTRTIHVGHVTDREREIYNLVLRANQALIKRARAGLSFTDYDGIPRQIIAQGGYAEAFTHGIGHGIGLDIHEDPFFNKAEQKLEAGMVVTDEPGIYIDNQFGLRIEDDLVISEDGCQVLTLAPKEIIVLK
ncbi:M24 family metallopeptidase [Streptococcus catagoni]|uniref:M24 family metallopeptidase n=1 Tax=Streptococcus catagoni TaxID=2654874 RepID=UPI00140C0B70|nr:Xaa-Pro peptidase family protein [Streptococcus catagoni]